MLFPTHQLDVLVDHLSLMIKEHNMTLSETLTSEDKGIVSVTGVLVGESEQFWAAVAALELLAIICFLSFVNLNDKREDLSIYQALPIAVLWSSIGIGLIVFNKLLFLPVGHGFGFPFAVFLMWWHALVGTIMTNVLRFFRPSMIPAVANQTLSFDRYKINVFPVAGLQACALALGNIAYLYISVAYIQMVKNTTSAFVYTFSILLALEKGSTSATVAVLMVVTGLVMTSVGEMTFTLIGFLFQMGGTLCDSLRLSLTKIILSSDHAVRLDPMSALYYSAPTMLMFLTIPMFYFDWRSIPTGKLWEMKFVLLSNALVAFGLNMTSMFFIKRCGPTTYALTGVVKDIALILLSCLAFGHPMTSMQMAGFVVSLAGFQLYNKLKEDQAYLEKLCSSMGLAKPEKECEKILEEATPLLGDHHPKAKGSV